MLIHEFDYDVALSFAGEDRDYVEKVAQNLRENNIRVFYDKFEEEHLWGKNLYEYLTDIYINKARYTIIFISKHYKEKLWTNHERKSMQARAFTENQEYILPAKFDDTEIPGIFSTIGYIHLSKKSPDAFSKIICAKLKTNISLQNELYKSDVRSILEGLKSPVEWFVNWSEDISSPIPPPQHWLLKSVFIERKLYSEILEEILSGRKTAGITGFLGMGGVGKTYTALKISWELIEKHDWQVVWVGLLQQGTEEALEYIAKCFGLFFIQNLTLQEKTSAIRQLVNKALHKYPKLLIVLDNAENFPRLDLLLEALRNAPVLVTSRKRECADIIPYRKIEPLQGESAVDFCKSLLSHYNFKIDERKNDIADLEKLCETLGGHPLGIRLALSGFIRKPLLEQLKCNRFSTLLSEIQRNKIKFLHSEKAQSNTLDEITLHKSIESTFLWTFDELVNEYSNTIQKSAYLLLPIMAALGTTNVTKDICYKGVDFLHANIKIKNYDEKVGGVKDVHHIDDDIEKIKNQEIRNILEWLKSSDSNFDAAISQLVDLALVEILDADKYSFAIHPLIREFAFHHNDAYGNVQNIGEQKSTGTLFIILPEDIFRMAIEVVGSTNNSEALLDLLPRLQKSRQLVEMAISQVKKQSKILHFETNFPTWPYLESLLQEALLLAIEVGLKEEEIWLQLELGELKDRLGKTDGKTLIDTGINNFIKTHNGNQEVYSNSIMVYDWIYEDYYSRKKILWNCAYNETHKLENADLGLQTRDLLQIKRLLPPSDDNNNYVLARLFSDMSSFISKNKYHTIPSELNCLNQNLISNIILDLAYWLQLSMQFGGGKSSLLKCNELYLTACENKEKTEGFSKETYLISIEHMLTFEKTYAINAFEYGIDDKNKFHENINTLRKKYFNYGIRGHLLESNYFEALAKDEFRKCNWENVAQLITKSIDSLSEVHDKKYIVSHGVFLKTIGMCASILSGNNDINLTNTRNIYKETDKDNIHTTLPILYLAEACLFNNTNDVENRNKHAAKSEKAFYSLWGYIPVYARTLLTQWRSWSSLYDAIEIKDLMSWCVDYEKLPEYVISKKDNRIMRLVKPGIQWLEDGTEQWMYPFYIDKNPLTYSELKTYCDEESFVFELKTENIKVVSLADDQYYDYLTWAGKRPPSRAEVFSAWMQHENKIMPEIWRETSEVLNGIFSRVQRVIKTGCPLINEEIRDRKQNMSSESKELSDTINTPISSAESDREELKSLYSGGWLMKNELLKERFNSFFLKKLKEISISDDEKYILSFGLATTISLSEEERILILKKIEENEVTVDQCNELIRILEEEKKKWLELEDNHIKTVLGLLRNSIGVFYRIVKVLDINQLEFYEEWNIKTTDIAHTYQWENLDQSPHKIHQKEALIIDDTKTPPILNKRKFHNYSPDNNSSMEGVLRAVIPIFTKEDLKDIKPLR